jgi:hypothetical protein
MRSDTTAAKRGDGRLVSQQGSREADESGAEQLPLYIPLPAYPTELTWEQEPN